MRALLLAGALAAAAGPALAQDAKAWLESQGLEAAETAAVGDFEVVVARPRGAADPAGSGDRLVVLRQGKPVWQTGPKDAEGGAKWRMVAAGRDLDGDGQPDVHATTFSGGPHCCTTHHVFRLKPQVRKVASYPAGNVGGGEFIGVPGRPRTVMISADDSSANEFAPYANSYFPLVVLEVGGKGRLQFVRELMQSRLPGQPPPVCATPIASTNPWLKERCGEYATTRRNERTAQIKARLAAIKAERAADKLKWEDYYARGVLAAVSAEMNRYTYTGHGNAAMNWLETVWPGNDAVKVRFVSTLRKTQGRSFFAEDLRALAADYR